MPRVDLSLVMRAKYMFSHIHFCTWRRRYFQVSVMDT